LIGAVMQILILIVGTLYLFYNEHWYNQRIKNMIHKESKVNGIRESVSSNFCKIYPSVS